MKKRPARTVRQSGPEEDGQAWNDAYLRFETPEQEVEKFKKRLRFLGANNWSRESQIVELFCGKGSGIAALESMGFNKIEGVDISDELISEYRGNASLYAGDCRDLQFDDSSRDILIVQGGLHHLEDFPADLDSVLEEACRVLRPGGMFVCVEPWNTNLLRLVHLLCRSTLLRRLWPKLDALAEMIEHERETYEQWLENPSLVFERLANRFDTLICRRRYAKLYFASQRPFLG